MNQKENRKFNDLENAWLDPEDDFQETSLDDAFIDLEELTGLPEHSGRSVYDFGGY